ncbi:MAG: ATP-grasp domain-containing protein [Lachnospiraceae bacterium]|nr:ATP-grasp domain-containing protein [Lachnospiraceae bacterium]
MNKPIFLLLGGNKLNYGILNKFQKAGYLVYIIDWNEYPQINGDRCYRIDVKDYKTILYTLKKDNVWENVKFVYSSIDVAVDSVAFLNRELGLKTISDEGLQYVSSKSMMVKRWDESGLLNRLSVSYTNYSIEIEELNKKIDLIIKPNNASSSRGITIIEKHSVKEEIINAFNKAKREATDKIVVVEEYVQGIEYTVDMIGDSYGNVCVYGISQKSHTKNTDHNRIAVKLHYNGVESKIQSQIAEFGILCYKALNFSSSLGHLEVILKPNGVITPIEIGARSSGFIASDLLDIVSGADYLNDMIRVQNGARIKNGLHRQEYKTSVYFFYDFPYNSTVKKECSILDFCDSSIISRYYDRTNIKIGKKFTKIYNDNARIGYEVLEGPSNILTIEYLKEAEKKMIKFMLGEDE